MTETERRVSGSMSWFHHGSGEAEIRIRSTEVESGSPLPQEQRVAGSGRFVLVVVRGSASSSGRLEWSRRRTATLALLCGRGAYVDIGEDGRWNF